MKSLIQKLVETPGPSGFESLIRTVIQNEIKDLVDEIRVDAMGNLIARKGKKAENGLRIMLSAHIDEIGLMVTHVDDRGFVRFTNIGGISPLTLMGGRVLFMNGTRGVIGLEKLDDASKMPRLDQFFLDVGADSRETCPVKVGDVCGFERPMIEVGKRLVAKSMDDRVCAAIAIEALKRLKNSPHELYFVFSVQEEVGLRGSTTAAYSVDPDLGLALDVTRTGDTPKGVKMAVALGNGPAIKVRDSSFIADPRVVKWMTQTAETAGIPYQLEILEAGGTDGRSMQLTRAGVPAGCLSLATRYIHSPSEMVDIQDLEQSVALLVQLISNPVNLG